MQGNFVIGDFMKTFSAFLLGLSLLTASSCSMKSSTGQQGATDSNSALSQWQSELDELSSTMSGTAALTGADLIAFAEGITFKGNWFLANIHQFSAQDLQDTAEQLLDLLLEAKVQLGDELLANNCSQNTADPYCSQLQQLLNEVNVLIPQFQTFISNQAGGGAGGNAGGPMTGGNPACQDFYNKLLLMGTMNSGVISAGPPANATCADYIQAFNNVCGGAGVGGVNPANNPLCGAAAIACYDALNCPNAPW
jgi:hypothetical protein